MSRSCARPECSQGAVATLSYAYAESAVWLEELALEPHPMTHDLCQLHADAVKVPRGWVLNDARSQPKDRAAAEPAGATHPNQVSNGAGLRLVGA